MSSVPPTSNPEFQVPSPEPRHFSFRRRVRAMLDWFHRPRPISAVSDSAPAADSATPNRPTGTAPLTQEQLQAMLPNLSPNLLPNAIPELLAQLLPSLLRDALADPAANPELTRALRAALLGPVVPVGAGLACTTVGPTAPTTANNLTKWSAVGGSNCTITDSVVFQDASNNIGVGTTTPSGPLDVGGWPTKPAGIVGVGSNINGDLFTGNTSPTGSIGRFRLASNANQGILSWNEYYAGGSDHKSMDSGTPAWRLNIGGQPLAGEDAFYVQRSPASSSPLIPVRLFQVDGSGNVGIGTGTGAPTKILSLGGNSTQTFWMERHTTSNTAGNSLTVQAGGATSGATNKDGGTLVLKPGVSTGTGTAKIQFQTPSPATSSGTSDNSFSTRLELVESNLSSPPETIATRIGGQLYTVPTSGQTQSAALYLKVVPKESGVDKNVFGILGEVTSDQADGYGGFMKIAHSGAGDAIFVPLYGPGGVAFEAATNLLHDAGNPSTPGTKGIISTVQTTIANPHPNLYNTLFTALWENADVPLYGMYFAGGSPGNALLIQKFTSAPDGTTQIRIMDNNLTRERFEVYNDGAIRISCPSASGSVQNSPQLRLRGADASTDREIKLQNVVSGSNQYRFSLQDGSGNERMVVTQDGKVGIGTTAPGEALTVNGSARIAGSGSNLGFYGATPQAKPSITGSRGGNAALANLLTALSQLGLITDNTTA